MAPRFVPLRVCSWFSLMEGVDSPETLLGRAADLGYDALALTDHNTLAGAVAFADCAGRFGIRPILGARLFRDPQRATVLIAEPAGYRSLCKIISRLHLAPGESFPAILTANAEGLHLLADDPFLLKPPLTDAFRGRLWCEIVRPGLTEAKERALLDVGSRFGARPVASLGAHFADPAGHAIHRVLCAVKHGQRLDQPGKSDLVPAHHLADENSVHERFRDLPDAVVNTRRLADACRSDVLPRGMVQPRATVPAGQTPEEYLRLLCQRALGQRPWEDEAAARARLERELSLIAQNELSAYFLAVTEIAQEARRRGWPMALRGSAGSSLACLLLGITDVNPLAHGLRLERFLHAGRVDLPDIDLDFASQVRGQVFKSVLQRCGPAHVARVGMIQTLGARTAFQKAAQAHGLAFPDVRRLVDELADDLNELKGTEDSGGKLAEVPPTFPLEAQTWPKLLASARALVGRPFELANHPSGFVLSERPIEEHLPLQRGLNGANLAQLDKEGVERVGLAKIDLLSNRSLSTLAEARGHVQTLTATPAASPAEMAGHDGDAAVLALLQRGDTLGISQLETPGQRRLLRQLRPLGLADVVLSLALSRPGVAAVGGRETYLRRRGGQEQVRYAHPCLEPVLGGTFGVLTYDDDILAVIEALTGWPASEADRFRKKLGQPADNRETVEAVEAFATAGAARDIDRAAVEQVLGQLRRPAGLYTLCKSHAVSYATIAWQEATLKARHPLAFWVAVLNNHTGTYPRRVYVEAIKTAGLGVLAPCANRSKKDFTQEVAGVRVGLGAIRSLGEKVPEAVLQERERGGPFAGLAEFRRRLEIAPGDLAVLIRVGCFDFEGHSRALLLREAGVSDQGRLPHWWHKKEPLEPWPFEDIPCPFSRCADWRDEWDLLGYTTGPPLLQLLRPQLPADLEDSRTLASLDGQAVRLAGLLANPLPASGEGEAQHATLVDEYGLVEVVVPHEESESGLAFVGPVALVEGEVQMRHGVPLIVGATLERPLPVSISSRSPATVSLPRAAG